MIRGTVDVEFGHFFTTKAEFWEPCCECCEFRQYVFSYCRYRFLGVTTWTKWNECQKRPPGVHYREDGYPDPVKMYGHRADGENEPQDFYFPDRKQGCTYEAGDYPGVEISELVKRMEDFPKLVKKVEVDVFHWFYGVIVDTCVGPTQPDPPYSDYGTRVATAMLNFRCRGIILPTGDLEPGSPTKDEVKPGPPGYVRYGQVID